MSLQAPSAPYEDAEAFVARQLEDEAILSIARMVGSYRGGQRAILKALVTVAGNGLARLESHAEAEALHRQRMSHHAGKAARHMSIGARR